MFVRAPANTDLAATFADLDAIGGVIRTSTASGATGHHAHGADDFVRQRQDNHHRGITSHGLYASCSYGEAVLSCRPRSHKVPPTDRGALAIHHGWECVGIVVSVGFDTVSTVEVLCDRRDRHVCESGGNQEALGKVACRGCA
jgi:hypothetical protein